MCCVGSVSHHGSSPLCHCATHRCSSVSVFMFLRFRFSVSRFGFCVSDSVWRVGVVVVIMVHRRPAELALHCRSVHPPPRLSRASLRLLRSSREAEGYGVGGGCTGPAGCSSVFVVSLCVSLCVRVKGFCFFFFNLYVGVQ